MAEPIPIDSGDPRKTAPTTPVRPGSGARRVVSGTPPLVSTPPRFGQSYASSAGVQLPRLSSTPANIRESHTPSLAGDPGVNLENLTDEDKAKVLRRHLVAKRDRETANDSLASTPHGSSPFPPDENNNIESSSNVGNGGNGNGSAAGGGDDDDEPFPIPYDALGGDITHPIYKWNSAVGDGPRRRSFSYHGRPAMRDPAFEHIHQPGGFRRNYLLLRQDDDDGPSPANVPETNNFIEFLYLFGHFAGEELEEIEEEDEEAEIFDEETGPVPFPAVGNSEVEDLSTSVVSHTSLHKRHGRKDMDDRTPLLKAKPMTIKRSMSHRRTRKMSVSTRGDATVTQAVLMMLKSFIGTGILFLGKAFYNGGWLFSLVTVSLIGLISLFAFMMLVEVKMSIGGSFGDMGGTLYGPAMRNMILFSIAISQIGFVTAYMIFIMSNISTFVLAFSKCSASVSSFVLIFGQAIILVPLALIRNLAKLSLTALIADVFILAGLIYIWGSEFAKIAADGIAQVRPFNPKDFPLLIGTAVFSFEGIGLVIPITDAMREPHKFPKVLSGVMIFLVALFVTSGLVSYLAFGPDIQPTVIINLNTKSPFTQVVLLLYSMAIILSTPIQLFPALRILENIVFSSDKSGRHSRKVKWEKNVLRLFIVLACCFISWLGSEDLDKFVSLVGCFACLPLCFIYPALLHLRACATTTVQKTKDWALFVFGVAVMVFSSVQTVRSMFTPAEALPPLCP